MSHVDFYFDYSSPFAYLGSATIEAVAERAGATMAWRPMFLGGVFKAVGTPMVPFYEAPKVKQDHLQVDMARWAAHLELPFRWPSRFPMMTVNALRLTLLQDDPAPFIHRTFAAYWAEDRDINDPATLAALLEEVGQPASLLEQTRDPAVKQRLNAATAGAVEAGVFGAPACVVDGQVFWGQDRFHFVEKALGGWKVG